MALASAIISSQNDGGFAESKFVRPISLSNLLAAAGHSFGVNASAAVERLKFNLNLLRPKHGRVRTHWTHYDRRWGESNLWDSWFRMLTIARIQTVVSPNVTSEWGFIPFPGLGSHFSEHHIS